jgi:hypothetical protein
VPALDPAWDGGGGRVRPGDRHMTPDRFVADAGSPAAAASPSWNTGHRLAGQAIERAPPSRRAMAPRSKRTNSCCRARGRASRRFGPRAAIEAGRLQHPLARRLPAICAILTRRLAVTPMGRAALRRNDGDCGLDETISPVRVEASSRRRRAVIRIKAADFAGIRPWRPAALLARRMPYINRTARTEPLDRSTGDDRHDLGPVTGPLPDVSGEAPRSTGARVMDRYAGHKRRHPRVRRLLGCVPDVYLYGRSTPSSRLSSRATRPRARHARASTSAYSSRSRPSSFRRAFCSTATGRGCQPALLRWGARGAAVRPCRKQAALSSPAR